jgi:hypothetical protein
MTLSAYLVWIGILVAIGLILDRLISKPSHKTSRLEKPYEAPLNVLKAGLEPEYQQYEVILRPHYSLDQHKNCVGFLTDKHIAYMMDQALNPFDFIIYIAWDIDDPRLAIIRADPGVELVSPVAKFKTNFKPRIGPRRECECRNEALIHVE